MVEPEGFAGLCVHIKLATMSAGAELQRLQLCRGLGFTGPDPIWAPDLSSALRGREGVARYTRSWGFRQHGQALPPLVWLTGAVPTGPTTATPEPIESTIGLDAFVPTPAESVYSEDKAEVLDVLIHRATPERVVGWFAKHAPDVAFHSPRYAAAYEPPGVQVGPPDETGEPTVFVAKQGRIVRELKSCRELPLRREGELALREQLWALRRRCFSLDRNDPELPMLEAEIDALEEQLSSAGSRKYA